MYLYLVTRRRYDDGVDVKWWMLAGNDESFLRTSNLRLGDRVEKVTATDTRTDGIQVGRSWFIDSVEPVFTFSEQPVAWR